MTQQPPINIYQLQKRVRPVIAAAQRIFTDASVRQEMTFLSATDVQDAKGIPISLRIDIKNPTDSRVAQSITIALTPSLFNEEKREDILTRERDRAIKAMRYKSNLSENRRANGMVDFADIPGGNMGQVPAEIIAESDQGGGE